ncbi:iron complex outermembrane recepter protein [Sphingomonas gellani]|uniref:Iron complex outermembrane recepter protein n=1 Tax=Sphingomonas gellani TaxID=1166340 RepID=A0A1H8DRM2_9SPHN|nr:TonB-dependent receptor [Sphingomonas gellani]SEN09815.1 iron complex outermembrane recepter protein [Sphingomonas gellani]
MPIIPLHAGITLAALLGATAAGAQTVTPNPMENAADHPPSRAGTEIGIGDIVVTAHSMARSTQNVLSSVDLLGGDIAQRQNVDNSWELFARLPGVVLTDFNQGTTSGRFSIRGFNGEGEINAVKLLIDGVPSNDNAGGMPFIDMVPPLDIDRVELVRGTSDPRWGLHAIAGSADIRTRIGGTYLDAKALSGAFGTVDAQLSAGVETGALSQNYLVSYRRTDGYRDHADLDRLNLAGKWFVDMGAARVGVIARYSTADAEEPGYLTDADAYTARRRSYSVSQTDGGTREMAQYSLHLDADLADTLALTAIGYANTLRDDRFVRFSANVAQQRRYTDERQYGTVAALHWHPVVPFLHDLMIEGGGDVQWQHNVSQRWTADRRVLVARTRDQQFDLTVGGGYLQAIIRPTRWLTLTPAWRLDGVSGDFHNRASGTSAPINRYGTISQPKMSAAITPLGGVTLYGNYGRTFQIGAGSGAYLVAPRVRDVDPSINTGWEGGLKLSRGRWLTARIAAWQQTASGELRRRLNDPGGDFDNLGRTRRRGIDVEANVTPLPGLSGWASWSHQRARILVPDPASPGQAGNAIDHVPANVYTAGIEWTPGASPLRLSLWGNGQSAYELTPANDQGRFGSYVQVTAEAGWRLTRQVELSLQLRNMLNDLYEYVWFDGTQRLHAPADPRSLYGALRLRL